MTMVHNAELAWRSPPRLRRCRWVFPELALTGDVPHNAAKDRSISQPLFFEDEGKWILIKGRSSSAAYPFVVNGEPFIPSAAVKRGEPRRFAIFVQNATPDEMTLETNPHAKMLTQLQSTTGSKLIFQLDPAAANAAMLNVTMKKKGSSDERTSSMPFVP